MSEPRKIPYTVDELGEIQAGERYIGRITPYFTAVSPQEWEAAKALFSGAPELYEALERLAQLHRAEYFRRFGKPTAEEWAEALNVANAALQKARPWK